MTRRRLVQRHRRRRRHPPGGQAGVRPAAARSRRSTSRRTRRAASSRRRCRRALTSQTVPGLLDHPLLEQLARLPGGDELGRRSASRPQPLLTAGTDLNILGQKLDENIRILQTSGAPVATSNVPLTVPQLLTQNQSIPRSTWIDPGLFAELALPVNDRLQGQGRRPGRLRAHRQRPAADHRQRQPVRPAGHRRRSTSAAPSNPFVVDPIVYSSNPTNGNLSRQFNLFSGFVTSEYKLDEHLTAIARRRLRRAGPDADRIVRGRPVHRRAPAGHQPADRRPEPAEGEARASSTSG